MENPFVADTMALVSMTLWPALLSRLLYKGVLSQGELRDIIEAALQALDTVDDFSPEVVAAARSSIEEFYALTMIDPPANG
jgi:hypothetical protein